MSVHIYICPVDLAWKEMAAWYLTLHILVLGTFGQNMLVQDRITQAFFPMQDAQVH